MVTLGFAILLATGLLVAKICQRFRLPSVTGYILAGVLLGPSGFNLINSHSIGSNLDHFTNIALVLISFGIGEHVELKKLRRYLHTVAVISVCEAMGAFTFVFGAVFCTMHFAGISVDGWQLQNYIALSLLLAAVGLATAPAATLLVLRELKASGPFTTSLLAIVAIDNGLAIMIFGFVIAFEQQLTGAAGGSFSLVLLNGFLSIGQSMLLGIVTGFILDLVLKNLKSKEERMTGGLALLLLCSEAATFFGLSSLLAGMAVGFVLVNRAERDVRLFRALNNFEPPIYVLFFTLAGTHLDIKVLGTAGVLGLIYFLARISGKVIGVAVGARISGAPKNIGRYLGFGLVPQAGVAIGLIFLIAGDPALGEYSSIITPIVLAGVFLSELLGPVTTRFAVKQVGEAHGLDEENGNGTNGEIEAVDDKHLRSPDGIGIPPWTWRKLSPQIPSNGVIAFGGSHDVTVAGLARFATIFANYKKCLPMAIRVVEPHSKEVPELFSKELKEVTSMGYPLVTEVIPDKSIASGIVAAVEYNDAKMLVLGAPLYGVAENYQNILESVASHVLCPVILIRFFGQLHTERILVPLVSLDDLKEVYPIIVALDGIGEHHIELLYLFYSEEADSVLATKEEELAGWLEEQQEKVDVNVKVIATDARIEAIQDAAESFNLVVMGASRKNALKKFFFGSLADAVVKKVQKNMLIVYMPDELQ
jgi:Kef-type K+ transport system membrane component KefB/nucleotide-binding universal stress UspA family protein